MKVDLKHKNASLPKRATDGSAGYDLHAAESGVLLTGGRVIVPTGLRLAIPKGWVGLIRPRSGLAVRHGIAVMAGTIDSDYRGEVGVVLRNTGPEPWRWSAGDRIAQLVVVPHYEGPMIQGDLDDTARGDGGWGSTG